MDASIATIEFDPGTSEVNQLNRIKLLTAVAKRAAKQKEEQPMNHRMRYLAAGVLSLLFLSASSTRGRTFPAR